MRREHFIKQSYIDWLKSIGCVLYLPLSENDFEDKISGNSLVYTGSGLQASWDSQNNMYIFTGPTYHSISYTLNTGWSASTFPTNSVTVMTTFKKVSTSGNGSFMCVGDYIPIGNATMQSGGTSDVSRWNGNLTKCAYSLSPSGRWFYLDGSLENTWGAYSPFLPNNWGGYSWFVGSYIGYNSGCSVLIKDVMMFNNVLDLATIRKIQGYE